MEKGVCSFIFEENSNMSKFIYIDVGAKVPTVAGCVKFPPNKSYEDSIIRDFDYTGQTQTNISITNYCAVNFTVDGFTLFADNTNGGSFEARVATFNISAGQTINIPVRYYGINKSTTSPKNYNLLLNGVSAAYKLNITVPFVNTPPVIGDIEINIQNRQARVFTLADFTAAYWDADGHDLDAVILEGDVSKFLLNGNPIVSGQEIPASSINSGLLQLPLQNTDSAINVTVTLKAKDEAGSVSA